MKPIAPIVLAALLARSNASAADEDLRALRERAAASRGPAPPRAPPPHR